MWATHEFVMQLDRERLCIVCNKIGCCCVNKYPLHDIVCKSTAHGRVCTGAFRACSFGQQALQPQSLLSSLSPSHKTSQCPSSAAAGWWKHGLHLRAHSSSRCLCRCPSCLGRLICRVRICLSVSCERISQPLRNQRNNINDGYACTRFDHACSSGQKILIEAAAHMLQLHLQLLSKPLKAFQTGSQLHKLQR